MGWDYDALAGDASYHLTWRWGFKLNRALDAFELLDWETGCPDAPESVVLERDEEDPWPFEAELDRDELDYFGFESPESGRVPGAKLQTNDLWLITAGESRLIADELEARLADPGPLILLESEYPDVMTRMLEEFASFCRACESQGGFWAY